MKFPNVTRTLFYVLGIVLFGVGWTRPRTSREVGGNPNRMDVRQVYPVVSTRVYTGVCMLYTRSTKFPEV